MEVTLDRSEFFTLAALMRARDIIGLAPEQLLPPTPVERQKLYDQGEARLRERDLLRINSKNEAVLEADLLAMMKAVVEPDNAVVVVRTTPAAGKQLFLLYEKERRFVEQTLPNGQSHRLAQIGSSAEVLQRLAAIFPVEGESAGAGSFTMQQSALFQMAALASENKRAEAEAVLREAQATNPDLAAGLLKAFAAGSFNGTIALLKVQPERENSAGEIAVVQGRGSAWCITQAADDPEGAHVEQINADGFRAMLNAALEELER